MSDDVSEPKRSRELLDLRRESSLGSDLGYDDREENARDARESIRVRSKANTPALPRRCINAGESEL